MTALDPPPTTARDAGPSADPADPADPAGSISPADVERRGRRWLLWSFLACPCHLPWTLAILATVLGGTAVGTALRAHPFAAGAVIAAAWAAGTARGLVLVRRAERGELTCALRT